MNHYGVNRLRHGRNCGRHSLINHQAARSLSGSDQIAHQIARRLPGTGVNNCAKAWLSQDQGDQVVNAARSAIDGAKSRPARGHSGRITDSKDRQGRKLGRKLSQGRHTRLASDGQGPGIGKFFKRKANGPCFNHRGHNRIIAARDKPCRRSGGLGQCACDPDPHGPGLVIAKQEQRAALCLDGQTKRPSQGPRLSARLGIKAAGLHLHLTNLAKPQAAIGGQGLDRQA